MKNMAAILWQVLKSSVNTFQIILIIKVNITTALGRQCSKKGTVIIKVHPNTKCPGMPQNYQNMFRNYKSMENNPL